MTAKKQTTTKKSQTKKPTSVVKRQLPSPITPLLALVALVFTYVSFSLAIDRGGYIYYIFGFYFLYQTVRLTKISIRTRRYDKAKRASKA